MRAWRRTLRSRPTRCGGAAGPLPARVSHCDLAQVDFAPSWEDCSALAADVGPPAGPVPACGACQPGAHAHSPLQVLEVPSFSANRTPEALQPSSGDLEERRGARASGGALFVKRPTSPEPPFGLNTAGGFKVCQNGGTAPGRRERWRQSITPACTAVRGLRDSLALHPGSRRVLLGRRLGPAPVPQYRHQGRWRCRPSPTRLAR